MLQASERTHCILLVDDQPKNLHLLEAMLEPLGYRLLRAQEGKTAIELFDTEAPDLVLLDLMMPAVDGFAVLADIRRHERASHVPVILVTAQNERAHRLRGLEAGADDFIEKPIDRPILLARVRTLLQLKESRDALQTSHDVLEERNHLLERLRREQREFTQFIVHDLKNPLAVVDANLQLAQERLSEGRSDQLGDVLLEAGAAAIRMRAMVEDLLVIARLEDADFPIRQEVVSVADFLRPIVASYSKKAPSRSISLLASPDVSLFVWADPLLLRRVLENILDNSLRYTPEAGRIGIEARAGRGVEIHVANTGTPIPAADRERIFEKFARGRDESPVFGNAGLGLYFCKRAIEAQGGHISLQETADWPTCFVIQLPPS